MITPHACETSAAEVRVRIVHDHHPDMDPREWDNLGLMACWHGRYNLGDVQPREDPNEWLKENAPKGSIVLPLYLMDHSGLSMSTGPFGCPWDSGQVGWYVVTPEEIRKEFSVKRISKRTRERALATLEAEVRIYDSYLRGEVWGFVAERLEPGCDHCGRGPSWEDVDSCFGFLGDLDDVVESMKEHLPEEFHEALERAAESPSW